MPLKIDKEKLQNWLENNFDDLKKYHGDYLINSIFKEDNRHKLSISVEKQCYHCWKTDKSGSLWELVSIVDKCSRKEAIERICEIDSITNFESKIDFLKNKIEEKNKEAEAKKIKYPDYYKPITSSMSNELEKIAHDYCVNARKIDPVAWRFGYCFSGKYKRRLIVPFFHDEKLIYWIARSLFNQEPKYLNPEINDEKTDVKKEEVIFSKDWNLDGQEVIVVEGALDAITLIDLGFNAISIQGKRLSDYQVKLLSKCSKIILGIDRDQAGEESLIVNAHILEQNGIFETLFVVPPLKDWNESYRELGSGLREYVVNNIGPIDFKSKIRFMMKNSLKKNR